MARKVYMFQNAGMINTEYSESNIRVNMDMKSFVSALEFKYEIVGVWFEKYKVGFMLREKQ